MNPTLHVVVFNVPWPPNYGGVIDAWYRLRELAAMGLRLRIHCFTYGREPSAELEHLGKVIYYPRRAAWTGFMSMEPYIVSSRASVDLLNQLLTDDAPILFDGLHTCHYLADPQLAERRKVVRMHNVEWAYYAGLAQWEGSFFKELYFREESRRLKRYETILEHAHAVACISPADARYYRQRLGDRAFHLPAFHPFERIMSVPGKGAFALYHGNLSVPENVQAASFLIGIWQDMPLPLVLAGMDPDYKLVELAAQHPEIRLVADPSDDELGGLVRDAQVHVLPAFQRSGIKLKLLRALFEGRFVVASPDMVEDTGLAGFCQVAESEEDWRNAILSLAEQSFNSPELEARKPLALLYANRNNADRLTRSLFAPRLP